MIIAVRATGRETVIAASGRSLKRCRIEVSLPRIKIVFGKCMNNVESGPYMAHSCLTRGLFERGLFDYRSDFTAAYLIAAKCDKRIRP